MSVVRDLGLTPLVFDVFNVHATPSDAIELLDLLEVVHQDSTTPATGEANTVADE